jgi:predicted dithiol-disulfide oxidoreductase (DUF899 family)
MGTFPWASCVGSDCNADVSVGFTGEQQRGGIEDILPPRKAVPAAHSHQRQVAWPRRTRPRRALGTFQWLDRAPKGRTETDPWWRRHDEDGVHDAAS